jgi:hypothetical protein
MRYGDVLITSSTNEHNGAPTSIRGERRISEKLHSQATEVPQSVQVQLKDANVQCGCGLARSLLVLHSFQKLFAAPLNNSSALAFVITLHTPTMSISCLKPDIPCLTFTKA